MGTTLAKITVTKEPVDFAKKLLSYKKLARVDHTPSKCSLEMKILDKNVRIRYQPVECLVEKLYPVATNVQKAVMKEIVQIAK